MSNPNLVLDYKRIYDSVHHEYIPVTKLACLIIDTQEFQRLKNHYQLGTCHFVFPSAVHTRFEHSIGTYYLAGHLLDCIKKRMSLEQQHEWLSKNNLVTKILCFKNYKLTDYLIELVKIAALCHDLGHGPFSHVFDDVFLKCFDINHPSKRHEYRSCCILRKIINNNKELSTLIPESSIKFIESLIDPPNDAKGFLYQIVSNNLNGIDVDKCDYLMRDSMITGFASGFDCKRLMDDAYVVNDIICYPLQTDINLFNLFKTRYDLHKKVYSHKVVIAVQHMVCDILKLMNKKLQIIEILTTQNWDKYCRLNEHYIFALINYMIEDLNETDSNVAEAYLILKRIEKRDFYKFICGKMIDVHLSSDQQIQIKSLEEKYFGQIIIHQGKIGYVSGNKNNPLDDIYFYNRKHLSTCHYGEIIPHKINKEQVSKLISNIYQENYLMIFWTGGEDCISAIKNDIDKII
jgi:HD superfamily phosphohydrolase